MKTSEFALIDILKKLPIKKDARIIKGIGDDCAVILEEKNKKLLLTTDMLVEDVHFTLKFSPENIGRKAVAVNVSDIAAMGGNPRFALCSAGLPKKLSGSFARRLLKGIIKECKKYGVVLLGGDTVRADKVTVNITLIGESDGRVVFRSGAKKDDYIVVTGKLGESAAMLLNGKIFIPEINVDFAKKLALTNTANAMIDISDGLGSEIAHIAKESGTGAEIYEGCVPVSARVPLGLAMSGGEDYELLFTVSPDKLFDAYRLAGRKIKLNVLGMITDKKEGLTVVNASGKSRKFTPKGYDAFV